MVLALVLDRNGLSSKKMGRLIYFEIHNTQYIVINWQGLRTDLPSALVSQFP